MDGPHEPGIPGGGELLGSDAPSCAVKLPVFEGPLDLLLHLIRLNEVDVTDIPILRIAEQYLDYIGLMRELDLDVAGEYLLMAATLAWIKSRMLLPPEPGEEDEEALDPRAELVARLLEYQRFKEAAGDLEELPRLGRDVFRGHATGLDPPPAHEREIAVGLFDLLAAMRGVLAQARGREAKHEVESDPVTVRERMLAVMEMLESRPSMEFLELFEDATGASTSRARVVATFLAILELARIEAVRIFQGTGPTGAPEGPIRLRAAIDSMGDWAARIGELM